MIKFPDRTLEKELTKRGYHVACFWQEKGPKDTMIAWIECLHASNRDHSGMFLVETFTEGGWNVFVEPTKRNDTKTTVEAVINALRGSCEVEGIS